MSNMCKKIEWGDRWKAIGPTGRSGGLLVGWETDITIHQIISIEYSIEVELESAET